jgi:hypothetical protein
MSYIFVFRRSSRSSVGADHPMGPFTSVFRMFRNNGIGSPIVEPHCCTTMGSDVIVKTHCYGTTLHWCKDDWSRNNDPRITLVQQWPTWCGVKKTFIMSVYAKEYTFPTLLEHKLIISRNNSVFVPFSVLTFMHQLRTKVSHYCLQCLWSSLKTHADN